jgi:hypothetical protein
MKMVFFLKFSIKNRLGGIISAQGDIVRHVLCGCSEIWELS